MKWEGEGDGVRVVRKQNARTCWGDAEEVSQGGEQMDAMIRL